MIYKRIFGYLFIVIAALFTLTIVGLSPDIFGALTGIILLISGKLDAHSGGFVVGQVFFWIIFIVGTIALWKYGLRWSKHIPSA